MIKNMDPPNHDVSFSPTGVCPWPLLALLRPEGASGAKIDAKPAFFHESLGDEHFYEWKYHAPSWMDPHRLLELCLQDDRIKLELQRAFRRNDDRQAARDLIPLVDETFDAYLAEIVELFEVVRPLFVAWMIRHYADTKKLAGSKLPQPQEPEPEESEPDDTAAD